MTFVYEWQGHVVMDQSQMEHPMILYLPEFEALERRVAPLVGDGLRDRWRLCDPAMAPRKALDGLHSRQAYGRPEAELPHAIAMLVERALQDCLMHDHMVLEWNVESNQAPGHVHVHVLPARSMGFNETGAWQARGDGVHPVDRTLRVRLPPDLLRDLRRVIALAAQARDAETAILQAYPAAMRAGRSLEIPSGEAYRRLRMDLLKATRDWGLPTIHETPPMTETYRALRMLRLEEKAIHLRRALIEALNQQFASIPGTAERPYIGFQERDNGESLAALEWGLLSGAVDSKEIRRRLDWMSPIPNASP